MKKTNEKSAKQLEKETNKNKKRNIKLYKIYEPFAWDLMFYYVVEYLFFTGVKGYNASQVLLLSATYIGAKFITQVPSYIWVSSFGKCKVLIAANLSLVLYLIMCLTAPNYYIMLLAQVFFGVAFCLKDACESDIMYD
jgi:MFS family permease